MTKTPDRYEGPLPAHWSGGEATAKWWRGKLMNLYRLTRACSECGGVMNIDVTKAALEGTAKNAGLHLKRCATCRARSQAIGTTSRPHVNGELAGLSKLAYSDTEKTIIATMKEELKGLYALNKDLRERLAKYEAPEKFPWGG